MPTPEELSRWMQAIATSGDRSAFAALFRHFAPRLKGFLMRSGCNDALAEELAQETMVQLWRRAAAFDPARAQLSTWLFTIARNQRTDHHRRQHGEQAAADEDAAELTADDDGLSPDALLLAAQRESRVRAALAALPDDQARVLRLSFYEEHPHTAISQQLGIPLGTVKSRIRLAVAQLRRVLEELR